MSLTAAILGKDIYSITLQDIINYFSLEREETSVLEFKSGGTTKEDIIREIGAMLNTEGGLLIIGAPQEEKIPNTKIKIAKGNLVPTPLIQDALMSSIGSSIVPVPVGIKATSFPLNGGSVIILEIPQSDIPPHQVADKGAYYIRLEREVRAAPHGLVQALFFKRQKPQLVGDIIISDWSSENDIGIDFILKNTSDIAARQLSYSINVNGVARLMNSEKILSDYAETNGIVVIGNNWESKVFVKGIEIRHFIHCKLTYPLCMIKFTFYCDESIVKNMGGIYDTTQKTFIITVDSDNSPQSQVMQVTQEYQRLRNARFIKQITDLLGITYTKPEEKKMHATLRLININFPVSFWEFINVFDGFHGRYKGMEVAFYNSEQLYQHYSTSSQLNSLFHLPLGKIWGYDLLLDYSKYNWDHNRFIIQKMGATKFTDAGVLLENIFTPAFIEKLG